MKKLLDSSISWAMAALSTPWLVLALVYLACSWVLLRPEMLVLHDYLHASRSGEMLRALQDGHIPPRWSSSFGYGYGMPLFQFYGPLPSYFGALFLFLEASPALSVKLQFALINLLALGASYALGKRLTGSTPLALLCATLFTLAPYRAVNLFLRGAVNESLALSFIPLFLWAALGVIQEKKYSWHVLVISTAGIALSHNLTTIIFLPFAGILVGLWWLAAHLTSPTQTPLSSKLTQLGTLASSVGLGLLMSMYYWLPAYLEKDATQVNTAVLTTYFNYILHFLYLRQFLMDEWRFELGSGWGPQDDFSFFFGYSHWAGLLFIAFGFSIYFKKCLDTKPMVDVIRSLPTWFWWLMGASLIFTMSILMTTEKTLFIWQTIEPLKYIQFPWRYMTVVLTMLAIIITLGLQVFSRRLQEAISIGLLSLALITHFWYFQPRTFLDIPSDMYFTEPETIARKHSPVLYDYIPVDRPHGGIEIEVPTQLVSFPPELDPKNTFKLQLQRTHEIAFSSEFSQEGPVTVSVAWFPGWYALQDGVRKEVSKDDDGRIVVPVDRGAHTVTVRLGDTALRSFADRVSLISLVFFFMICVNSSLPQSSAPRRTS